MARDIQKSPPLESPPEGPFPEGWELPMGLTIPPPLLQLESGPRDPEGRGPLPSAFPELHARHLVTMYRVTL